MKEYKPIFSVVVMPNARYHLVETHKCPLGRTDCHAHGADASFCTRGNSDGMRVGCVCRMWGGRLGPDDIKSFGNEVRVLAGAATVERIMRALRLRTGAVTR